MGALLLNNEFVNGISFEENVFEKEVPEKVTIYDLDGNEVDE